MRYELSRYGNTRFEVVDTEWPIGWQRCVAILFDVTLQEANEIVALMNGGAQ